MNLSSINDAKDLIEYNESATLLDLIKSDTPKLKEHPLVSQEKIFRNEQAIQNLYVSYVSSIYNILL